MSKDRTKFGAILSFVYIYLQNVRNLKLKLCGNNLYITNMEVT